MSSSPLSTANELLAGSVGGAAQVLVGWSSLRLVNIYAKAEVILFRPASGYSQD